MSRFLEAELYTLPRVSHELRLAYWQLLGNVFESSAACDQDYEPPKVNSNLYDELMTQIRLLASATTSYTVGLRGACTGACMICMCRNVVQIWENVNCHFCSMKGSVWGFRKDVASGERTLCDVCMGTGFSPYSAIFT